MKKPGNEKFRPKRKKAQKSADRAFIEHWYVRGKTCETIAKMLSETRPYKLSRQQIQYDLKLIDATWKQEAFDTIDEAKRKQLAGLQAQEDELWLAWEKSKLDATSQKVQRTGTKGDGADKVMMTKEGQCGDPSYMRLILEVRDRVMNLLGLNAATRQEISGPDGGPIQSAASTVHIYIPDNGRDKPAN